MELLALTACYLTLILVLQQHLIDLMLLALMKNGHFSIENLLDWPGLTLGLLLDSGH